MNKTEGIKIFSFSPKEEKQEIKSPLVDFGVNLSMSNAEYNFTELYKILGIDPPISNDGQKEDSSNNNTKRQAADTNKEINRDLIFFMAGECTSSYSLFEEDAKWYEDLSSNVIAFLSENYESVIKMINDNMSDPGSDLTLCIVNVLESIIDDMSELINSECEEQSEWIKLKELLTKKGDDELDYIISLIDKGCSEETLNVLNIVFPKLIEVYNKSK